MRTITAAITVFFVTIYSASLVIIARILRRPVLEGGIYERAMHNWASNRSRRRTRWRSCSM